MTSEVLTEKDFEVLKALMKTGRAATNAVLRDHKAEPNTKNRDKLEDLELIEVDRSKRTFTLTLTEKGLEHANAPAPVSDPPRPPSGGLALGLTPNESLVLIVLMARAREVPNSELKLLGPELAEPSRKKLERLSLITVDRSARPMTLSLADKGWAYCKSEFGTSAPPKSTSGARAVYTMMYALHAYFESNELLPNEVFRASHAKPTATTPVAPNPGLKVTDPLPKTDMSIEDRIRDAYASIAEPGQWVSLSDLRSALPGLVKEQLDEVLVLMNRTSAASLLPEENKKSLTSTISAAAVKVAGEDHHHIMIGRV